MSFRVKYVLVSRQSLVTLSKELFSKKSKLRPKKIKETIVKTLRYQLVIGNRFT